MSCAAESVSTRVLRLVRFTRAHQKDLEAFYNAFEPKGEALGLPPRTPDAVHEWIESLILYPNFLIFDEEKIIGHSLLCPEVYTGEVAVFVAKNYRGAGVGKRLLRAVIAEAMDMDLRRIWGISEPDNIAMLRLAQSCGFTPGKELGEFTLDLTSVHHLHMPILDSKKK